MALPSLSVKTIDTDSEHETLYQRKEVRLGSKRFETPIIAFDPSLVRGDDNVAPIIKGFNEIYRRVETKKTPLNDLISNIEIQDRFNSRINTQKNKTDTEKEVTLCYIEHVGNDYPKQKELEFILDTSYCYSDIVPLPIIHRITQKIKLETEFKKYLDFMKTSIEFLNSFNKKPIIGIIPRLAYRYMEPLVEFYVSNDITSFSVDLACRNVVTLRQPLRSCFRQLNKHRLLENGFINAVNTSPGRFIKEKTVINSKDILCFGFGFDSIGRRHRPLRLPPDTWDKIDRSENKLRIFNKDDYGYYKIMGETDIDKIYHFDSSIPRHIFSKLGLVKRSQIGRLENIYNIEQLGLEAFRIRNIVKDDSPSNYISEKQYVKKQDVKKIKKFKKDVSKVTL